jgi:hypothetical protein
MLADLSGLLDGLVGSLAVFNMADGSIGLFFFVSVLSFRGSYRGTDYKAKGIPGAVSSSAAKRRAL